MLLPYYETILSPEGEPIEVADLTEGMWVMATDGGPTRLQRPKRHRKKKDIITHELYGGLLLDSVGWRTYRGVPYRECPEYLAILARLRPSQGAYATTLSEDRAHQLVEWARMAGHGVHTSPHPDGPIRVSVRLSGRSYPVRAELSGRDWVCEVDGDYVREGYLREVQMDSRVRKRKKARPVRA